MLTLYMQGFETRPHLLTRETRGRAHFYRVTLCPEQQVQVILSGTERPLRTLMSAT